MAKIRAENPRPEAGRFVVNRIASTQGNRFKDDDHEREAHGELWKEVMKRRGKCKMKAVN
jgi:hypothetical protein